MNKLATDARYDEGPALPAQVQRRLAVLRALALADLVLLALLLTASASGLRTWVSILGPLHGGNFLLLFLVAFTGATDRLWPWWLPGLVLVTAGPPGALVGERVVRRRLRRGAPAPSVARPAGAES